MYILICAGCLSAVEQLYKKDHQTRLCSFFNEGKLKSNRLTTDDDGRRYKQINYDIGRKTRLPICTLHNTTLGPRTETRIGPFANGP